MVREMGDGCKNCGCSVEQDNGYDNEYCIICSDIYEGENAEDN